MANEATPDLGLDHGSVPHADRSETRTRAVVGLTVIMMVLELVVGELTGSLALTADGWHMATHAGALGMAALAYWFARTRSGHSAFTFGTGKVYALAGYTSALSLAVVALWMLFESVTRLLRPTEVHFAEALPVAVVGLVVNLASAWLLQHEHEHEHDIAAGHAERLEHEPSREHDQRHTHDHGHAQKHAHGHGHGHGHDHGHDHDHGASHRHEARREGHHDAHHAGAHHDHNLRAAYMHVLADAFTSVLAIAALLAGRYLGLRWLDPVMGIVGSAVIIKWSWGLCAGAARQLLDMCPSPQAERAIRACLEANDDVHVADLHIWDLGPGRRGCVVSLFSDAPRETQFYRQKVLATVPLSHLTLEVHRRGLGEGHAAAGLDEAKAGPLTDRRTTLALANTSAPLAARRAAAKAAGGGPPATASLLQSYCISIDARVLEHGPRCVPP